MFESQNHPIERIMDNALTKIKAFASTDTILGQPIQTADGASIIPVSKVTMGFLTGGGEYSDLGKSSNLHPDYPFAGGSGAGVSVSPIAFLVSDGKTIKLVGMDDKNVLEKLIDTVPELLSSLIAPKNKKGGK
ncbi:MAG: GerW family sporulation protein [Firmicutes bacterium]|nr:GerW family sporulation protein [Bacillota bacterium]